MEIVFALLDHLLVVGGDVFNELVDGGDKLLAIAIEDGFHARQLVHAEQPVFRFPGPTKPARVTIGFESVELAVDGVFEIFGCFVVAVVETFHRCRFEIGELLLNFVLRGGVDAVDLGGDFFALLFERALRVFLFLTGDAEIPFAL